MELWDKDTDRTANSINDTEGYSLATKETGEKALQILIDCLNISGNTNIIPVLHRLQHPMLAKHIRIIRNAHADKAPNNCLFIGTWYSHGSCNSGGHIPVLSAYYDEGDSSQVSALYDIVEFAKFLIDQTGAIYIVISPHILSMLPKEMVTVGYYYEGAGIDSTYGFEEGPVWRNINKITFDSVGKLNISGFGDWEGTHFSKIRLGSDIFTYDKLGDELRARIEAIKDRERSQSVSRTEAEFIVDAIMPEILSELIEHINEYDLHPSKGIEQFIITPNNKKYSKIFEYKNVALALRDRLEKAGIYLVGTGNYSYMVTLDYPQK